MNKLAALKEEIKLRPHQEAAINRTGDSTIFAHGVGSGKTLTGIAKFEKMKSDGKANKALVIVPAGLRDNFASEGVSKFTTSKVNVIGNKQELSKGMYGGIDPNADYNVISYEMFRSNPEKYLKESGADTVISDESHRSKNEGTITTDALKSTRNLYKNYIGLTGSIVSNSPSDVQPLIDVASGGKHKLGESKKDFSDRFVQRSTDPKYSKVHESRIPMSGFKDKNVLSKELMKYIDYMDYDDVKDFANMPNKQINLVKVPVSKQQAKIYKDLLRDTPKVKKMIKKKRLETLKDEETAMAYNKMIEGRKLMNSVGSVVPGVSLRDSAKITPKTKKLLDDLENHLNTTPDGQGILFSHLINGGVDVLEAGLKERKIPYGKFVGKGNKGVTEMSRQQDANDFKARKNRAMIISGAGAEGISLNDTTWEGVLDPHYNPEKMKQMEARGVRGGGLSHRKPEDRNVQINRYMATMPKTLGIFKSKIRTPDEFIYEVAQKKELQNQMMFDLLKDNQKVKQKRLAKMSKVASEVRKNITTKEALSTLKVLGVDISTAPFDLETFRKGMVVELEHGRIDTDTNVTNDNLLLTGKIALAHLNESPLYYKELEKMEKKLDKVAMYEDYIYKEAKENKERIEAYKKRYEEDPLRRKGIDRSIRRAENRLERANLNKEIKDNKNAPHIPELKSQLKDMKRKRNEDVMEGVVDSFRIPSILKAYHNDMAATANTSPLNLFINTPGQINDARAAKALAMKSILSKRK